VGKRIQSRRTLGKGRGSAGFSLVEVAILAVFLLVAVGGLSSAVLSSLQLSRTTEESALADEAARGLAADMQSHTFRDIFKLYNADPNDDPVGIVGPGAAFDVRGLTPRAGDADGRVGRIEFPAVPTGVGTGVALREDFDDRRMAMPRDLNGNGADVDDASADYLVLPVRLIVEWTGAGGNRSLELDLALLP